MDQFNGKKIPLSVSVIDMDWHLVSGDEVQHVRWTGYTWNKTLFPDPKAFAQALHDRGLKITLNDHPHADVHCHEEAYEKMARVLNYDISQRLPIQFDPTDPTFMEAFFNVLHRHIEDNGCDFWWIDWQQGNLTKVPGLDPLWLLNHFQFIDAKTNKDGGTRPIILSRFAGPGSHRYPVRFSGDVIMTWESLAFQPEFTATASNIGFGWWSHDLGGHMAGYRDDELMVRWIQFGAFSPILRLHSSNSPWTSKEPWCFRSEAETAIQHAMQLRHRLVPYLYSATTSSTLPLIQPLYWNFPTQEEAFKHPNQYYFGESLMVVPIVQPRDRRTNMAQARAWVPPGRHVDIFSGIVYDGDRELDLYRPLHNIAVFAQEGSIIPLDGKPVPSNGCKNPHSFEVLVVVGRDCEFTIVEDLEDDTASQNGLGQRRIINVKYIQALGRLTTVAAGRGWAFRFISLQSIPGDIKCLIDGEVKPGIEVKLDNSTMIPSLLITFPSGLGAESILDVQLWPDPQLTMADLRPSITLMITDYQIENDVKNRIWDCIKIDRPVSITISSLLALGLEQSLLGPISELLLADSRN